jgi:hypothetical protein
MEKPGMCFPFIFLQRPTSLERVFEDGEITIYRGPSAQSQEPKYQKEN